MFMKLPRIHMTRRTAAVTVVMVGLGLVAVVGAAGHTGKHGPKWGHGWGWGHYYPAPPPPPVPVPAPVPYPVPAPVPYPVPVLVPFPVPQIQPVLVPANVDASVNQQNNSEVNVNGQINNVVEVYGLENLPCGGCGGCGPCLDATKWLDLNIAQSGNIGVTVTVDQNTHNW